MHIKPLANLNLEYGADLYNKRIVFSFIIPKCPVWKVHTSAHRVFYVAQNSVSTNVTKK